MAVNSQITTKFTKDLIDEETGEKVTLNASQEQRNTYRNVTCLDSKLNINNLGDAMAKSCSSTNSIKLFWKIINYINTKNLLKKDIQKLGKEIGMGSTATSKVIRGIVESNLAIKVKNNVYFFNPYVITGKRISMESIEYLQAQWTVSYKSNKTYVSMEKFDAMLAKKRIDIKEGKISLTVDKTLMNISSDISFNKRQ